MIGGTNDDEVVDFARWSRETGYEVRFIEYMPLDAQHAWEREKVVPAARILAAIDAVHPLLPEGHANEPATTFRFADGAPGRVGVIASVTEPFCDTCNRLRLTAEGMFRNCLFAMDETDLRAPMRGGASDDDLALLIRQGAVGEVVRPPDQPPGLRPTCAIDVDDRRLIAAGSATAHRLDTRRSPPAASLTSPWRLRPLSGAGSRPQAGSPRTLRGSRSGATARRHGRSPGPARRTRAPPPARPGRLRLPEPVLLAFEQDVGVRQPFSSSASDHDLGLMRRNDAVLVALQQEHRARDPVRGVDR